MVDAHYFVDGEAEPRSVQFTGPDATFSLRTDHIRAKCRAELDTLNVDLLEIAAVVFAADSAVKRGGATRPKMGEGWRRKFDFVIPVRNPSFWNREDVRTALVETVEFLTEDHVRFSFIQQPVTVALQPFLDLDPSGASFEAEQVILFSGGLDSFAGALEALSTTRNKVILVTHRSAQKAIPRQVNLGDYLAKRFKDRVLHIHVLARRMRQEASDSSQRSRSFLFVALGQLVARSFGARQLSFYENGVISHNLPISSQVVGTMATRTTHPLSLHRLNALMQLLGPDHVTIENRYCWLTKRDVVERIALHGGGKQIASSVSCTSIREQTTMHTHCGKCSQCLDRRFALLGAGLEAHDFATDYATDILFGQRAEPRSQTMAVEWTRHALNLSQTDPRAFMAAFGTEFSRISQGHPEESKQAVLDQCIAMHARHARNVHEVLERVLHQRSDDILKGELPPTCLVALVLAQSVSGVAPVLTQPTHTPPRISQATQEVEVDLVTGPDEPFRIAFDEENGRPVVRILGLCDLRGPRATVPTDLKPAFLHDRRNNLECNECQYVPAGTLAETQNTSKDAIRQQVSRCRKAVAASFEDMHGQPLEHDRFIQNKSSKGYRLAPSLIPVREDES